MIPAMTLAPPLTEPTLLVAGDTAEWTRTFSGYSAADGDVLAYHIGGKSVLEWDPAWAVADGSGWHVTIPAASTKALQAGIYRWFARITTSGGTVKTVAAGELLIEANPATAGEGTFQYWEEAALAIVRKRLTGDLSAGVMNYMLFGRSVGRYSLEGLMKVETQLENRLEQRRNGGQPVVQRIPFAFRRPL